LGWELRQPKQRLSVQLRRLPLFRDCGRQELTYLTRWADVVSVPAGQVLVREGPGSFWVFVLLDGRVQLRQGGAPVGEMGAGDELGHESLVGFRPHPLTATAVEDSILLVLRPRFALSLLTMGGGIQRSLYPDLSPAQFPRHFEEMLEAGRREWRQLSASDPAPGAVAGAVTGRAATALLTRPSPPRGSAPVDADRLLASERLAGRRLSLAEAAGVLARGSLAGVETTATPVPAPTVHPLPRWVPRVVTALAAAACLAVLFFYHLPRYAVEGGRPIDVAGDISIRGAPVHPVQGRLLLLWVQAHQPDLAGFLWDFATGVPTVGVDPSVGSAAQRAEVYRSGRSQYRQSQATAVRLGVQAAGLDPRMVRVRIRDRGFVGPSGGLVYALAVYDLLTGRGPPAGSVVAATGELSPTGAVQAVGWVDLKSATAYANGATALLVPDGEQSAAGGPTRRSVLAVRNLTQAILAQPGG
jgi:hypothetical protein